METFMAIVVKKHQLGWDNLSSMSLLREEIRQGAAPRHPCIISAIVERL